MSIRYLTSILFYKHFLNVNVWNLKTNNKCNYQKSKNLILNEEHMIYVFNMYYAILFASLTNESIILLLIVKLS